MRRLRGTARSLKLWCGGIAAMSLLAIAIAAPAAQATSYTLSNGFESGGSEPIGIAIDQSNGDVYVANPVTVGGEILFGLGRIAKFDAQGTPGTPAVLNPGSAIFSGVAIDPISGHVYGAYIDTSTFNGAVTRIDPSNGEIDSGFPFADPAVDLAQIAVDSSGNIYVPNVPANVVEKYSAAGALLSTFDCSACTGGAFSFGVGLHATVGVAIDGSGNLYVPDSENNRVMKMATSDPTGAGATVFYEGAASAVAINPATGNVFVGGDDGSGYHVTEHEASGAQISNFGEGAFLNSNGADQIAVNETSGDVYVTDGPANRESGVVYVFSPVPSPTATTGSASAVTKATATLNGTVNPEGVETTSCVFEYGVTTAYGSTAPCSPNPGSASTDTAVSAAIGGLAASTTYHFRVVETTEGEPAKGQDAEFTTLASPPQVTTGAASGIGQQAATIAGTINPGGIPVLSCQFEYGTTASYGTSVPCPTPPGSGNSAVAESLALSGLSAGTTYHYRLVGSNAGGPTNGSDATFTTLSPPSGGGGGPAPAPAPAPTPAPPAKKPLKCKKGFKKKTVHGKAKCVKVKKKHKKH